MTTTKLSPAQLKTLGTIIANAGEMNGWAGQKGFYCNSITPLKRMGLVENADCPCGDQCTATEGYECPTDGNTYYNRIRITDAGRVAHREATR